MRDFDDPQVTATRYNLEARSPAYWGINEVPYGWIICSQIFESGNPYVMVRDKWWYA